MDNIDQLRIQRNALRLEVLHLRKQMKLLDRRIFMMQKFASNLHGKACLEGLGATGRMTARQLSRVTAMSPSTVTGALVKLVRTEQVRIVCYEPQPKGVPAAVYEAVPEEKNETLAEDSRRLRQSEGAVDPLLHPVSHTPNTR